MSSDTGWYGFGDTLTAYLLSGSPEAAKATALAEKLGQVLQGGCSVLHTSGVPTLYDMVIDSGLVSEPERKRLRARMAYLAYRLADPSTWDRPRGYCSGNPNMTAQASVNLGLAVCTLADHPMAEAWLARGKDYLDRFLSTDTGPQGEQLDNVHYMDNTLGVAVPFAITVPGMPGWPTTWMTCGSSAPLSFCPNTITRTIHATAVTG